MTKKILGIVMLMIGTSWGYAQGNFKDSDNDIVKQGWTTTLDVGLDFVSNLLINPSVGGGDSQLGFGAALGVKTQYNNRKFSWDTEFNIGYAVQKSGSGTIAPTEEQEAAAELLGEEVSAKKAPFEKNLDNIWLNSRAALRTSYFSKFYYAADLFFSSQLTPTYEDNYLSDVTEKGNPISEFLSPATTQLSVGMEYRPNDYWSIFASPASYKAILVLNDAIARDFALNEEGDVLGSIHGNDYDINQDGTVSYENTNMQLGALLRVRYENILFKDRLAINTNLSLFSNYLEEVDHIDVNWRNEIEVTLFKGLSLSLYGLLTYDHDVFVQITDNDTPGGVQLSELDFETPKLGRRVSYTQQLLLKYTYTFE